MNKFKSILSLLLVFAIVLAYAQQTEEREVAPFTEISLHIAGIVYLTQGQRQQVELKGPEDILENIETKVRNGKLIITSTSSSWFDFDDEDLEVFITMKNIEGLSVSGSGKIKGENKIKTDDMDLSVSGSGKIEIETAADEIDFSISGSGTVDISGTANEVDASISGSGRVNGAELKTETCDVKISGSGDCKIYVEDSLDARISGSGNVYYKGNPKDINSHTSGSGSVRKL